MYRLIALTLGLILAAVMFTACETETDSTKEAREKRQSGVDQIRKKQPVNPMNWSPTMETMNRWSERWGQEGKVAYVYMQRQDGEFAGYYVLSGLPVSYCTAASPPYDVLSDGEGKIAVPATGLDGAYYGSCDENRYYGFDAVTGQYIEYTDGFVLTAVLSDQPLSLDRQPNAYVSSVEDVKNR